jgi:hypothetical protein
MTQTSGSTAIETVLDYHRAWASGCPLSRRTSRDRRLSP